MVESWVPQKDELLISARVPKKLAEFVDYIAKTHACNRTEAIRKIVEYARDCDEIYRYIKISGKTFGRADSDMVAMANDRLSRLSNFVGNESKRMAKEKRQLEKRIENRIHPAIIDAGRQAGSTISATDKVLNRTTAEAGFLPINRKPKLETEEDAHEKTAFNTSASPAGSLTNPKTREQHDKAVKRRAKSRDDNTVMSGSGWA